jgi:hypothetical protein
MLWSSLAVGLQLVISVQSALPPEPPALAAIDRSFVCPEKLPDNAMRLTADQLFIDAMKRAAPDASPEQVGFFREHLLRNHNCAGWVSKN